MGYAASHNVNHLTVDFGNQVCLTTADFETKILRPIPDALLTSCPTLKTLELSGFRLPESFAFTTVTSLHLAACKFPFHSDTFDFSARFPNLEELWLRNCEFSRLKVVRILGSKLLRLHVDRSYWDVQFSRCDFQISASNVTFFSCTWATSGFPDTIRPALWSSLLYVGRIDSPPSCPGKCSSGACYAVSRNVNHLNVDLALGVSKRADKTHPIPQSLLGCQTLKALALGGFELPESFAFATLTSLRIRKCSKCIWGESGYFTHRQKWRGGCLVKISAPNVTSFNYTWDPPDSSVISPPPLQHLQHVYLRLSTDYFLTSDLEKLVNENRDALLELFLRISVAEFITLSRRPQECTFNIGQNGHAQFASTYIQPSPVISSGSNKFHLQRKRAEEEGYTCWLQSQYHNGMTQEQLVR
ncbi:hypothetical protein Tsubulata_003294 [Turnera subulata]|uniref:FBD domain-containing protein n=1 Tax=Turnera subulata TaxID=218843 RepID=A0A9Q0J4H5_9ROSI|nr:hypothetical protein Tsubulata_003294 [Turnera subulata]